MTAAAALSLTIAGAATFQNVVGTVTDPQAELLQGIRVSFFDALNAELIASATTDAGGRYDSSLLPAGTYRVRLSDPSVPYASEFFGAAGFDFFCDGATLAVPASTTTVLDLAMLGREEPRLIAGFEDPVGGTVVDAATGMPLPGIIVSFLTNWNAQPIGTVVTGNDGVYSFGDNGQFIPVMRIRFSDPTGSFFSEFYGAGSDAFCSAPDVRAASSKLDGLLDRVPPEHLTQQLADTVTSYDLPAGVATMLGTSLTQLRGLVADSNGRNDAASCRQLAAFVTRVDLQERRGELTAAQAGELRAMAANVGTALGCQ
jgi:hypothetical protein